MKVPSDWWSDNPRVRVKRLGLSLELDLRDNLQRTLYFTGTYEPEVLRFIEQELRVGDVVLDVGAHIGIHALRAAKCLQELGSGRVIAVEASTDTAARLREGAAANGLNLTILEIALGSQEGMLDLRGDSRYEVADAGIRSQFGDGPVIQTVRTAPFDLWAADQAFNRLDVVKIDVEGAEPDVLVGMRKTLASYRPRALIVEMKDVIRNRSSMDEECLRMLLSEYGYRTTGIVLEFNEVFRPSP